MSDFEIELDRKLSTPAGRNWMRARIRDTISGQAARLERQCTINRMSSRSHEELRTAIEVAEIGEPDAHTINWIGMLNEALDLKGRTTKDEAARLSHFGVSFLQDVKCIYYVREKRQMLHHQRATNSFHEIDFCSYEHRGIWMPINDERFANQIKGQL